ncbi:MAG: universal stress protein [Dehalococcoidales bacterium]|jgi:nucleotide-binding universal stress UspA family protein|nr:universal stress protein [Dehalococcoidales bacterium]MDP6576866.1 universal stress protein [Dehalococcoidales bacterium]MDP7415763.1 universal stress protein [Dehalococcoidales bacterium]|tara:strand:+ start:180 stop:596 length:417 start_codon:yes stop_codon:yes gene_type:complete
MEFRKILVPVSGTEADEEAMKLACRLAKKDKGRIWSVYVVTIKRALPLDTEIESGIETAEAILDHIEMVAEEQDCEIETDVLQAREVGPAIIDEAVEREVDLILMGAKYKRRFGQFSLGSVAPYVLQNSLCPVILYHQ